jgi:hypothetical protein
MHLESAVKLFVFVHYIIQLGLCLENRVLSIVTQNMLNFVTPHFLDDELGNNSNLVCG